MITRSKKIFLLLIFVFFVILLRRQLLEEKQIDDVTQHHDTLPKEKNSLQFLPVDCQINENVRKNIGLPSLRQKVKCIANDSKNEVYVPFSFIKKYFDVYGVLSGSSLIWSHSYSKVFPHFQKDVYDPGGSYLQFSSFDVENRQRVKCVSAQHGVPVTTQWDKSGYYYATQICQYGLAHWSKAKMASSMTEDVVWVENGDVSMNGAEWSGVSITRVTQDKCVHFDNDQSLSLSFTNPNLLQGLHVVSFDLLFREAPIVTLEVHCPEYGTYELKYSATAKETIAKSGTRTIILGYAQDSIKEGQWKNFTRNILNDLLKGIFFESKTSSPTYKKSVWTVKKLSLSGVGCITNIGFAKSRHMRMFYHAADWLVESQNPKTGAWHVNVPFNSKKSKYPFAGEIGPGWISAMGSAHAMSVLTRAFRHSGKKQYLVAAIKALRPFSLLTNKGGVKASFMGNMAWPNSFVLNGFMYSLIGLYDLWQTLQLEIAELDTLASSDDPVSLSESLFNEGVASLVAMAPLFDTGAGSTYDLRHFTMGGPPKLARWDYHSTHINLLYVLSTIVPGEKEKSSLQELANRWQSYMVGERADHN